MTLVQIGRGFDAGARICASLAASTLRLDDIRSDTEQRWGRFHTSDAEIDRGLFWWEQYHFEFWIGVLAA